MRDYQAHPVPQGAEAEAYRAVRAALTSEAMPVLTRSTSVIRFLAGLVAGQWAGALILGGQGEDAAEAAVLRHVDERLSALLPGGTADGAPPPASPRPKRGKERR